MKAIKVGYVIILSFLLFLIWSMYMMGDRKLQGAPKAPTYPTYNPLPYNPQPSVVPFQTYDYKSTPAPIQNNVVTPVPPSGNGGILVTPEPQITPASGESQTPFIQSVQSVTQSISDKLTGKTTTTAYPYYYQNPYSQYKDQLDQYEKDLTQYQKDMHNFTQNNFIPKMQKVIIISIALLVAAAIIGIILGGLGFSTLGAGYIFAGLWGLVFGPGVFAVWFARVYPFPQSPYASALSDASNSYVFNYDAIIAGVGNIALLGVIILTVIGLFFLDKKLNISAIPKPRIRMPQMPNFPQNPPMQ